MCFDCLLLKISQGIINYLILLFPVQKIGGSSYLTFFMVTLFSDEVLNVSLCLFSYNNVKINVVLWYWLFCTVPNTFLWTTSQELQVWSKSQKGSPFWWIRLKIACKIILWIELVNWVHKFISASNNVYPDANIHVNNLQ